MKCSETSSPLWSLNQPHAWWTILHSPTEWLEIGLKQASNLQQTTTLPRRLSKDRQVNSNMALERLLRRNQNQTATKRLKTRARRDNGWPHRPLSKRLWPRNPLPSISSPSLSQLTPMLLQSTTVYLPRAKQPAIRQLLKYLHWLASLQIRSQVCLRVGVPIHSLSVRTRSQHKKSQSLLQLLKRRKVTR